MASQVKRAATRRVASLAGGGLDAHPTGTAWGSLVYLALVATCLGFVVQAWAQSALSATTAAVVMTMEPVFAGLFAVVAGGERLGPRTILGAVMVLAAMVLTELGPRRGAEGEVERLEV